MATDAPDTPKHETVLDVTGEQIARTYATAFLSAANETGNAGELVEELQAVVEQSLDSHPKFGEALRSAFISHEEQVGMIDRVFGGRVNSLVTNLLKVMSSHRRLNLLRSVATQSVELWNTQNNRITVEVVSADQLGDDLLQEISTVIERQFKIEPMLSTSVDPGMIAGLRIRVGDTVYDGSLKTVFERSRKKIIADTIEKIEKDPNLFSNK